MQHSKPKHSTFGPDDSEAQSLRNFLDSPIFALQTNTSNGGSSDAISGSSSPPPSPCDFFKATGMIRETVLLIDAEHRAKHVRELTMRLRPTMCIAAREDVGDPAHHHKVNRGPFLSLSFSLSLSLSLSHTHTPSYLSKMNAVHPYMDTYLRFPDYLTLLSSSSIRL